MLRGRVNQLFSSHFSLLSPLAKMIGPRLALVTGAGIVCFIIVRTAWICDDAFITLRTVDNFINGYGLVWNVGERVQTYTHPLWMFVLSAIYALSREPYYSTMALSIGLSAATVGLILWQSRLDSLLAVIVAVLLGGSKAFIDYSTSGLENPLAHLLLATFVVLWLKQTPSAKSCLAMGGVAGLVMLNRLDHGLLVMPALLVAARGMPRGRAIAVLGAAVLPAALWTIFSLLYYGFPFPNTYYAKQAPGIPRIEYLLQGVNYWLDVWTHDPITPVGIVGAPVLAIARRRQPGRALAVLAGLGLYAAYILWIGGDYMTGRLFSAPFVMAVALIPTSRASLAIKPRVAMLAVSTALSLLVQPLPNLLSGADYAPTTRTYRWHGKFIITDERAAYYQILGLLPNIASELANLSGFPWVQLGQQARQRGSWFYVFPTIGMIGYYAGPGVYIVDNYALGDAFLARLRADLQNWRIGHIWRRTPDGYLLSKSTGQNLLRDPELASLYDKMQTIISGPLFSAERFSAIFALNLGRVPAYFIPPHHRNDYFIGELDGSRRPFPIKQQGKDIILGYQSRARALVMKASAGVDYALQFKRQGRVIHSARVPASACTTSTDENISTCLIEVYEGVEGGYDQIHLTHSEQSFTPTLSTLTLVD